LAKLYTSVSDLFKLVKLICHGICYMCDSPGAKLLLADPVERNPRNREKFLQIFLESSSVQRFELEKIEEQTPHMDGSAHPVKVLHFKSV
jgi:hypothetical protein